MIVDIRAQVQCCTCTVLYRFVLYGVVLLLYTLMLCNGVVLYSLHVTTAVLYIPLLVYIMQVVYL